VTYLVIEAVEAPQHGAGDEPAHAGEDEPAYAEAA
jgi:hypothetical protein